MKTTQIILILFAIFCSHFSIYSQDWNTSGNSVGSTDFMGTTNNNSLKFKTNGTERMVLSTGGKLSIYSATSSSTEPNIFISGGSDNGLSAKNIGIGFGALSSVTTGATNNNIMGYYTANSLSAGYSNVALGSTAMRYNINGTLNTAVGHSAFINAVGGNNNVIIGDGASSGTTGSPNNLIVIGSGADVPNPNSNNQIRMGNTNITYAGIQVDWTITSDLKWKKEINPLSNCLKVVNSLNPVEYIRISQDGSSNSFNSGTKEYGFIAQEVDKTFKNLGYKNLGFITQDLDGLYGIRYNDFIPILTKAIQEQQVTINELKIEIEDLRINKIQPLGLDILFQNKPNPFSSKTNISYFINDCSTDCKIIVFNVNGEEIFSQNIENNGKGSIEIQLDENFNQKEYIYSLVKNGKIVSSRKMLFSNN